MAGRPHAGKLERVFGDEAKLKKAGEEAEGKKLTQGCRQASWKKTERFFEPSQGGVWVLMIQVSENCPRQVSCWALMDGPLGGPSPETCYKEPLPNARLTLVGKNWNTSFIWVRLL